jgi:hypothetical protein
MKIHGIITMIIACWLINLAQAPVAAATVTINFDPGTTHRIPGVSQRVTGAMMGGMLISCQGNNGAGETIVSNPTWEAISPDFNGVNYLGTGLESGIIQSGDTFFNPWTVFYYGNLSHINRITFDAFTGNTVFDTSFNGDLGTPGSWLGHTFDVIRYDSCIFADITVTYRDQVAIADRDPVGDLYRFVDLYFGDAPGFRGQPAELEFLCDTDRICYVPLPSSLFPFGASLAGLIGFKRFCPRPSCLLP